MSVLDRLMEAVAANEGSATARLRSEMERILAAENLLKPQKTAFELAMEKLKEGAATMPAGFEFEIPQVIGAEVWSQLDRGSKLALGKHVKASQDAYGVKWLRTSTSNHAIYRRAD
jgi:hypothetical protein